MAGGTRARETERSSRAARRVQEPRFRPTARVVGVVPRSINIAWASITDDDLQPNELVYNENGNSLVYREGRDTIYRFDNAATRAI